MNVSIREALVAAYLDYTNNYLTVELFAEHNHLTVEQALGLINLARAVFNSTHPEG